MKKSIFKSGLLILFTGTILLISQYLFASTESVIDRIKEANIPFDSHKEELSNPIPQDTVHVKTNLLTSKFKVLTRKKYIDRFPCSQCHLKNINHATNGNFPTHSNISIQHGPEGDSLACFDCHNDEDRDFLIGKKNIKVDIDHSYQLCGKCHFRQKNDWIGGAHGKRVQYWAGERIVYNCATCHDPHSPRFKKRMPATFSRPLDQ